MDAISREWLKTAIHNFYYGLKHIPTEEDIQAYIDAAPSVSAEKTPMIDKSNFDEKQYRFDLTCAYECGRNSAAEKTGYWIKIRTSYGCSECSLRTTKSGTEFFRYCPNCGARMEMGL